MRQGPNSSGSVKATSPSSGVLVLPRMIRPAALYRRTVSLSVSGMNPRYARDPWVRGTPARASPRSLSRKGTPAKGLSARSLLPGVPVEGHPARAEPPAGRILRAASRACSKRGSTTAFKVGLNRSMRSVAASTTSTAVTWPVRMSWARPRPS